MNYIGSKKTLINFISYTIGEVTNNKIGTFIDLFAGTGIVGEHYKKLGYNVISNDMQYYSYVLNKNYIENSNTLTFSLLENEIEEIKYINHNQRAYYVCKYLDNIELVDGFIFDNYCINGSDNNEFQRNYFSEYNGKKADAIRIKIEYWKQRKLITENEYYFLLATLLENIDKVANTASVYAAYLKHLKKSAQKKFAMIPATFSLSDNNHCVYNEKAEELITKIKGNILYLDPPYNSRQYSTNYHILETIAKYDNPKLYGKTGLRENNDQKSVFSQKGKALNSLIHIINNADVDYIFLSYNNEGILDINDIRKVMSVRGEYGLYTTEYTRFKSDKTENRNHKAESVKEYLHYVICNGKKNVDSHSTINYKNPHSNAQYSLSL